jgi:carboxymethylenebutenolidase
MRRTWIDCVLATAIAIAMMSYMAPRCLAQDWAKDKLAKSPRHQEWVKVTHDNRDVNCFVVYPEVKDKAPAIIVIHEIFGLTDWVEDLTDQLADAGYIAIAPDLLWGKAANGEGTDAIIKADGAQAIGRAIQSLPADQITADLNAVAGYAKKLPSCNGKLAVCGFCWGGGQTFRYATNNPDLKAAFSFYGPPPTKEEDVARINCPVYGFYGGDDNRIDSMIPAITELMKKAGKTYEPVTYEGAGHGFMRAGEQPDAKEANKKARDEAWARWKDLLKQM